MKTSPVKKPLLLKSHSHEWHFKVILIYLLAGGLALSSAVGQTVEETKVILPLRAGKISAELFEKGGRPKGPAILVLHGAGGTLLDGPEMRRVARRLAADGNAVYFLRYFESTGTLVALDGTMQRHFRTWLETVRESIDAIQRTRADATPVGLYGYSLGGFLALAAASDNARVGAVVEHAGGVWNSKMDRIQEMPPVLMVHGEQDGRVPFAQYAKPLLPVLRRRAVLVTTRFFPGEGHVFKPVAMAKVREEAATFFRRHLRRR